jgi:hypothetical protein
MHLADMKKERAEVEIRSIASVSGGSLTNAFVALDEPFNESPNFRASAGRFAKQMAGSPGSFRAALGVVIGLVVLTGVATWAGLGDQVTDWWPIAPIVVSFLVALIVGPRSRGSFWAWWGSWLYVAVVAWLVLALIAVWWVDVAMAARVISFLVGLALTGWLISRRNLVSDYSFRATVCRKNGAPALLSHMNQTPQHVMCATELHGPHHIYMSRGFIWNWDFGIGEPGTMQVATAVQASSNLPGAFPVRWLSTAALKFVLDDPRSDPNQTESRLGLTDGGVYDNMGEQWADGMSRRTGGIRSSRLGPGAVAIGDVTSGGGIISVSKDGWERMAISGSQCDIPPIPLGASDADGNVALQASTKSGTVTDGKNVRIDSRTATEVTVVNDYAPSAERVNALDPPDPRGNAHLLMANASAGRQLAKLKQSRIPVLGELPGLMSVVSALYDNGTAIRRRDLVGRWLRRAQVEELAEQHSFEVGWPFTQGPENGQIIQIDRSPWRIPKMFDNDQRDPERAGRAAGAIAYLRSLDQSEEQWKCIAADNAEVATTFKPLGVEVTARLLYHAYVLSNVDLHVLLGYPLLDQDSLKSSGAFANLITSS